MNKAPNENVPGEQAPDQRDALLADARQALSEYRRRLAEVRARKHVGAAGWAQTSTLEAIIRAGREGSAGADALRQAVRLTTEQVRALPLSTPEGERAPHARALDEVVRGGEEQMGAAEALDELVRRALDEVAEMPAEDVSVRVLQQIHERVQAQVASLSTIIESARAQAGTLEQLAHLERVSADHQRRVEAIRQLSVQEEVQALGSVGEEVVERIAQLDEADAHQLGALSRIGEAVAQKVADTGTSTTEQVQTLEALARTVQEKAEDLRKG